MSIHGLSQAPNVLLVDSDNTVRGTVASVCRDLNVARVFQATSVASAEQWLKTGRLKSLVLSMGEEAAALALLTKLRAGKFPCGPGIAVVVMAHECTVDLGKQLKDFQVRRLLLQPFKLRDVIQTLEQLWIEGVGRADDQDGVAVPEARPTSVADDEPAAVQTEPPGETAGPEASANPVTQETEPVEPA